MKAKIERGGRLLIGRKGGENGWHWRPQICMVSGSGNEWQKCSDFCPLFVESGPATVNDCYDHKDGHRVTLHCAPAKVVYDIEVDERKGVPDE